MPQREPVPWKVHDKTWILATSVSLCVADVPCRSTAALSGGSITSQRGRDRWMTPAAVDAHIADGTFVSASILCCWALFRARYPAA